MYNDDTRNAYSNLLEYVESKYDNIESNEDFRAKFQELLESDEEFQNMIHEFNEKSVYNKDAIKSVDDFLSLGEKLFPSKEENDLKTDETRKINKERDSKKETEAPKVSTTPSVAKSEITKKTSTVPFYKKAIRFVKSMPDITKTANAVSLGAFGMLGLLNAIGGGGLGYVAAVVGLPIPAITATYYVGKAIYKSYKSGKIRKWLDRNKDKHEYEPLPTPEIIEELNKSKALEPIEESKIDDKDIFFPNPDIKVEPIPEPIKPVETTPEVSTKGGKEDKGKTSHFNPATDLPVFKNPNKKMDIPVTEPKTDEPEHEIVPEPKYNTFYDSNEYDEPVDNVTYDPTDFDFVQKRDASEVPEVKTEEYKGRHIKKNMPVLEEGYKERRIAELESEIKKTNDEIEDYDISLNILNQKPIFEEDEARKQSANNAITRYETQKETATTKLANMQKELNDLKGIKEEKDLYTLLSTRHASLSKKLKNLPDTPENKELRDRISATIGQIKKYMDLTKLQKDNPYVTEEDKKKLTQVENIAYTTTEYVWDELYGNGTKRSRRGK